MKIRLRYTTNYPNVTAKVHEFSIIHLRLIPWPEKRSTDPRSAEAYQYDAALMQRDGIMRFALDQLGDDAANRAMINVDKIYPNGDEDWSYDT